VERKRAYTIRCQLLQTLVADLDHLLFAGASGEATSELGVDDEALRGIGLSQKILTCAVDLCRVDSLDVVPFEDLKKLFHLLRGGPLRSSAEEATTKDYLGVSFGHCV
jgi:hypothetical protein